MKRISSHYYVLASGRILGEFMSFALAVIFAEAYASKCHVHDVDIYHGTEYVCSYKMK